MAQLPFLIVHGALVWKLLLVGLVAATYAISYVFRRRGARKLARALLARQQVSSPKAGPISVRGRIKTGTATSLAQGEISFDQPATELTLDCDGELVELVGTVRVDQGTTTSGSWRAPAATDVPRWRATLVRTVAVGDEVIASGVLVQGPGEPSTYRESKSSWRMQTDDVIHVLAVKPHTRAMPLEIAQHVGVLVLFSSIWLGALYVVGSRALSRAEDQSGTALDGNLASFGAAEIAAAMPRSRIDALSALEEQLTRYGHARSERSLQLQVALHELDGRCPARLLTSNVRLERALAAARSCDHDMVVGILALEGRFDEAEHELVPGDESDLATVIQIANGHWAKAAEGADERAALLDREAAGPYRTQSYLREAAAEAHCLAALFRSYGGERDTFANVKDRGTSSACPILEALSRPLTEQAAALAAVPASKLDVFSSAGYELAAEQFAVAAGGAPERYHEGMGVSALLFSFEQTRVWVAPFQLAAHPDDTVTPLARENMIAVATMRGDLAEAREQLSHLSRDYDHDELALSLAIRDGSPLVLGDQRDHPGNDEAISLRQGKVDGKIQQYLDDLRGSQFRANLERAANGDGLGLVAALQEPYLQWQAFALPVLGLLPRITSHREEAIAALRMFRNDY
ncbi:MAG TPA: hypothetical protein VF403_13805, partial [Kofleriaceae bacterium]